VKNRTALAGAAIAACLAIPATAHAHTATVTCNPAGGYQVTTSQPELNPTWTFTTTTVEVTWSDGFRRTVTLPPACPTPAPVPLPPPVDVPPPTVVPPPTCAELVARYPKAGPVRRAAWGCPTPVIRKPRRVTPPAPRVVTCRFVLTHYRGAARARMIAKHRLPATCGRPYTPPVAG
jgi:hypothetical protein